MPLFSFLNSLFRALPHASSMGIVMVMAVIFATMASFAMGPSMCGLSGDAVQSSAGHSGFAGIGSASSPGVAAVDFKTQLRAAVAVWQRLCARSCVVLFCVPLRFALMCRER